MRLSLWILFVALVLSTIAAYYSILGLVTIFSAAALPIIIMASAMEVSKVSITVWLHKYWSECRLAMKLYLVPAVGALMLITSMGVFGLLSRAHSDQGAVTGDVAARVAILDEKIKTERDNIEAARQALQQMNAGVDQTLARSTTEQAAGRAVQIRRSQARERQTYQAEITRAQEHIAQLNEERAPIASQLRRVEAEVGPVKYVAALIYGDNPDANLLERAVRWVIVLLVSVFDPLAIVMVLAAQESIKWERRRREVTATPVPETSEEVTELFDEEIAQFDRLDDRVQTMEDRLDTVAEMLETDIEILSKHVEPAVSAIAEAVEEPVVEAVIEPVVEAVEEPTFQILPELEAYRTVDDVELARLEFVWSRLHPEDAAGEHRSLLSLGIEPNLPWCQADFVDAYRRGDYDYLLA